MNPTTSDTIPTTVLPPGWSVLDGDRHASGVPEPVNLGHELEALMGRTLTGRFMDMVEASAHRKARAEKALVLQSYARIFQTALAHVQSIEVGHADQFDIRETGSTISVAINGKKVVFTKRDNQISVKSGCTDEKFSHDADWGLIVENEIRYLIRLKPK